MVGTGCMCTANKPQAELIESTFVHEDWITFCCVFTILLHTAGYAHQHSWQITFLLKTGCSQSG